MPNSTTSTAMVIPGHANARIPATMLMTPRRIRRDEPFMRPPSVWAARATPRQHIFSGSTAEYKEAIVSMLEEADRLTHLVDTLLRLSHGDAGIVRLSRALTDLGQFTR